ncbi:MAG TPA: PilZ domain-containing protein [Caulobacteraceae bacterium]|nr:PilZ domain-containing protein [Caulobacteraceae bacterium]
MSSALSKVDLRAHPREVVNRRAKALDGLFALDGTIRNISPAGLLLSLPGRTPSAEEFVVVDLDVGHAYLCKLVWRKGPDHGMRILKSQELRGLVPGQFDPARRIWRQAARGR